MPRCLCASSPPGGKPAKWFGEVGAGGVAVNRPLVDAEHVGDLIEARKLFGRHQHRTYPDQRTSVLRTERSVFTVPINIHRK